MSDNSTKMKKLEMKVAQMEEMQREQWGCCRISNPFVENASITIASNGHLLRIRGLYMLPLEIPLVPCIRAAGTEPIDLKDQKTPKSYEMLVPIMQLQASGGNDPRTHGRNNRSVIKGVIDNVTSLTPPKKDD